MLVGATLRSGVVSSLNQELKEVSAKLKDLKVNVSINKDLKSNTDNISDKFASCKLAVDNFAKSVKNSIVDVRQLKNEVTELAQAIGAVKKTNIKVSSSADSSASTSTGSGASTASLTSRWADEQEKLNRQMELAATRMRSTYGDMFDESEFRRIYDINSRIEQLLQDEHTTWRDIRREIDNCTGEARQFQTNLTAANRTAGQVREQTQLISNSMQRFIQFYAFGEFARLAKDMLRGVVEAVKEVDSSMVELKKVTDETESSYANFQKTAGRTAKELGVTLTDYIDATTNFARMDVGGFVAAQEVAKVNSIFQAVSENLDADTASKYMISIMKAYNIEAENTIEIVDKLNNISNKYAITTDGLGEALTRGGASLAAANNDLAESIALVTAANNVIQDPKTVGNALKTVSMKELVA